MTERLYIGSWIFNTTRTTNQYMPGAAANNIDLAAWITSAIDDGLISTGGGGGAVDTIYNADGTVQDRIITVTGILSLIGDANQCELSANVNNSEAIVAGNDGKYILSLGQDGAFFTDTTIGNQGLRYAGNYSSTFVSESLVTKRYVDNQIDLYSAVLDTEYATGTYTLGDITGGHKLLVTSTSGVNTTINLGNPASNQNKIVTVKFAGREAPYNIVVSSAFDIEGTGTYTLDSEGECVTFVAFDGTWLVINKIVI